MQENHPINTIFGRSIQKPDNTALPRDFALALLEIQQSVPDLLSYYQRALGEINPATFDFLTDGAKQDLQKKIDFTKYLLELQLNIDSMQCRRYNENTLSKDIASCEQYIGLLTGTTVPNAPISESTGSDFSKRKTKVVGEVLGTVNVRRLYWVWTSLTMRLTLALFPPDLYNTSQATQTLNSLLPVAGYISWILYYVRLAMNLCLVLKHTIPGTWLSPEERAITAWERFKNQLAQRKFALINDLIWGPANMVSYFWLAKDFLGYIGGIVTGVLLLADLSLTALRFHEESVKHEQNIIALRRQLTEKDLEEHKNTELQNIISKLETDWIRKRYMLINDMTYGSLLFVGYSLITTLYLPTAAVSSALSMCLPIVGASICFVTTICCAAAGGVFDINQTKKSLLTCNKNLDDAKVEFSISQDSNDKKLLYLKIKSLEETKFNLQQNLKYQIIKLTRSVLVDALIPGIIFTSLLFMPLGVGLAVIAAGLLLSILSQSLVDRSAPKEINLPKFDVNAYYDYNACKDTSGEDAPKKAAPYGL